MILTSWYLYSCEGPSPIILGLESVTIEYSKSQSMSPSKLGHKRLYGFSFSVCIIVFKEANFLIAKTLNSPTARSVWGRTEANSKVSETSWKQILQLP